PRSRVTLGPLSKNTSTDGFRATSQRAARGTERRKSKEGAALTTGTLSRCRQPAEPPVSLTDALMWPAVQRSRRKYRLDCDLAWGPRRLRSQASSRLQQVAYATDAGCPEGGGRPGVPSRRRLRRRARRRAVPGPARLAEPPPPAPE